MSPKNQYWAHCYSSLLLIYQNVTQCKIVLYADDTALFYAHKDVKTIEIVLQQDLHALNNWFSRNVLLVNCTKTNIMLFGTSQRLAGSAKPTLSMAGTELEAKDAIKYLGLIFDCRMKWHNHIDE